MLPRSYRHALVRAHLCHPPAGLSHGALNFFYSFSSFSKRGLCLSFLFGLPGFFFLSLALGSAFGSSIPSCRGGPQQSSFPLLNVEFFKMRHELFCSPARGLGGFSVGELFLFPTVLRVVWLRHTLCFFLRAGGMIHPLSCRVPSWLLPSPGTGRAHVVTFCEPSQGSEAV